MAVKRHLRARFARSTASRRRAIAAVGACGAQPSKESQHVSSGDHHLPKLRVAAIQHRGDYQLTSKAFERLIAVAATTGLLTPTTRTFGFYRRSGLRGAGRAQVYGLHQSSGRVGAVGRARRGAHRGRALREDRPHRPLQRAQDGVRLAVSDLAPGGAKSRGTCLVWRST